MLYKDQYITSLYIYRSNFDFQGLNTYDIKIISDLTKHEVILDYSIVETENFTSITINTDPQIKNGGFHQLIIFDGLNELYRERIYIKK